MDFTIFGNEGEEFLFFLVICTVRDLMEWKLMKDFLSFGLLHGNTFHRDGHFSLKIDNNLNYDA